METDQNKDAVVLIQVILTAITLIMAVPILTVLLMGWSLSGCAKNNLHFGEMIFPCKLNLTKSKGFTLIELLVVIAIIGTLSGMVLVAMTDARARARDARRQSDLTQIRKALELYYAENAIYPNVTGWRSSNNATAWAALATPLAPYIKQLPSDPINTLPSGTLLHAYSSGVYTYSHYAGTGTYCPDPATSRHWYMLLTRLEKPGSVVSPGVKCPNGTYNYPGTLTVGMVQK